MSNLRRVQERKLYEYHRIILCDRKCYCMQNEIFLRRENLRLKLEIDDLEWKLATLINYQLLGNYQELSCEILYFIMWNCNYVKE